MMLIWNMEFYFGGGGVDKVASKSLLTNEFDLYCFNGNPSKENKTNLVYELLLGRIVHLFISLHSTFFFNLNVFIKNTWTYL